MKYISLYYIIKKELHALANKIFNKIEEEAANIPSKVSGVVNIVIVYLNDWSTLVTSGWVPPFGVRGKGKNSTSI